MRIWMIYSRSYEEPDIELTTDVERAKRWLSEMVLAVGSRTSLTLAFWDTDGDSRYPQDVVSLLDGQLFVEQKLLGELK